MLTVSSVTATTISLMWTSAGSVVNGYEVEWTYDGDCAGVSGGSASVDGDETSLTINGLEEFSPYSFSVNASNDISSAVSNMATGMTSEAGMFVFQVCFKMIVVFPTSTKFSSFFYKCNWFSVQYHCPVGDSGLYPTKWNYHRLLSEIWSSRE